jgi:hypothetical protein
MYLTEISPFSQEKYMLVQAISKTVAVLKSGMLLIALLMFSACGGGGSNSTSGNGLVVVGSASSSVVLTVANPTLQPSGTTTVTAVFKNLDGTPVAAGTPVNFSTTLGTLTPADGKTVTDASGTASVSLTAGSISGQGQITASASINNKQVTRSINFSVNQPTLVLGAITLPDNSTGVMSYGATQNVSVTVTKADGTLFDQAVEVVFSSVQASAGKATISSPVLTNANTGIATATYTALSVVGVDTITASIPGSSQQKQLTVNGLDAGSISYVSAVPTKIGLKGMGGLGVQETSKVTFKVVDTSGSPKANQQVTFSLNTYVGGLSLSTYTGSTAADGTVTTIVQAGVVATPVRVTATCVIGTTPPKTISTQSDQLVVSTGIPSQDGFSTSSSVLNVEGLDYDGVTNNVTILMSDHFHNPVPDGTAVSFTTSCGSIQDSCVSSGGGCTVVWKSQAPRTSNGKCTILAYAVGEEDFLDTNGNGVADGSCTPIVNLSGPYSGTGTGLASVQTCGEFHDYSEAFRDDNWDGIRNPTEAFIDFNSDGKFNGPDGLFTGVLQGTPTSTTSGAPRTKHVFKNQRFLISGSTPGTLSFDTKSISPAVIVCTNFDCSSTSVVPVTTTRTLTLKDVNGNPMPGGTRITVTGLGAAPSSFVVPDGIPVDSLPSAFDTFDISLTATTTQGSGPVTVTVATPRGITTSGGFTFSW